MAVKDRGAIGQLIGGAEKLRFWSYTGNFMRAFENAYIQSTQDATDPRHWAGMKRMVSDFREYWPKRKTGIGRTSSISWTPRSCVQTPELICLCPATTRLR